MLEPAFARLAEHAEHLAVERKAYRSGPDGVDEYSTWFAAAA